MTTKLLRRRSPSIDLPTAAPMVNPLIGLRLLLSAPLALFVLLHTWRTLDRLLAIFNSLLLQAFLVWLLVRIWQIPSEDWERLLERDYWEPLYHSGLGWCHEQWLRWRPQIPGVTNL